MTSEIESLKDASLYGMSVVRIGIRKWWNPLRYIKGAVYKKRIPLKEVYK